MPFWTGIGGKARKIIAPFFGVGGKARRVVKGYVGVGNKARLFYDYMDDIDRVELVFNQCLVKESYEGETIGTTRAVLNTKGSFSVSGATATLNLNTNSCIYVYAVVYAVLKDGYKLRINYPYSNDGKAVAITVRGTGGSGSGASAMFFQLFGGSTGYRFTNTTPFTVNMGGIYPDGDAVGTGYTAMIRHEYTYKNGYTFSDANIGGTTYSITCVDAIA